MSGISDSNEPSEDSGDSECEDHLNTAFPPPAASDPDWLSSNVGVQPTDAVKLLLALSKGSDPTTESYSEPDSVQYNKFIGDDTPISTYTDADETANYTALTSNWKKENLHVFVLSEAGKPVYSRCGDESRLASIMGVMQALVSFVAASGDELQAITASDKTFVFLTRPHLILVAVGSNSESRSHLLIVLTYVYSQILSLLTLHRLEHWFNAQKNLDLRRFLVGDSRFISSVIEFAEDSFEAFLQAVSFLPLQPHTRDAIAQIINQSVASISVVFGLLLHRNHVVSLVRMKGQTLHPMDVHLIINLVRCSPSLKSAQSHWVPVCLPKFDANGFLYANITFSDDLTCLVLLTVDSTQFYSLDAAKDTVFQRLTSTNDGEYLTAVSSSTLPLLRDINTPQLRHLVCKYLPASQCVATDWATFYTAHEAPSTSDITLPNSIPLSPLQKDILSTYRRLNARLHNPSCPVRMIYQSTSSETFFTWKNDTFEVFCTLDPLTTKLNAFEIRKTVTKWLNSKKHQLFSLSNPTF